MSPLRITIIVLAGVVLAAGWMVYARRTRYERIRLIVPDGFRGHIRIQFDCPDGDRIRSSGGFSELLVPASGVLRVRDPDPFLRWHTLVAQTQSGKSIPRGGGQGLRPDRDYLWELGTIVDGAEEWFAIGLRGERDAGMTAKWSVSSERLDPPGGGG